MILVVITCHLYYETADERFETIKCKLETIASAMHGIQYDSSASAAQKPHIFYFSHEIIIYNN
jgi:hypothetical protein